MEPAEIERIVREVVAARGQLDLDVAGLDRDQSLYDAGMTSQATVKVMLGLESRFDLEFPDELLERAVFDRVSSIAGAIEKLLLEV